MKITINVLAARPLLNCIIYLRQSQELSIQDAVYRKATRPNPRYKKGASYEKR